MKKLMVIMSVLMFSLVGTAQAQEINEQNPYELVKGVASKTFDRIKANQEAVKADPEMLRTIMEEELVPHIDYKFAAFMVLGKHFKSVPQEKKWVNTLPYSDNILLRLTRLQWATTTTKRFSLNLSRLLMIKISNGSRCSSRS